MAIIIGLIFFVYVAQVNILRKLDFCMVVGRNIAFALNFSHSFLLRIFHWRPKNRRTDEPKKLITDLSYLKIAVFSTFLYLLRFFS